MSINKRLVTVALNATKVGGFNTLPIPQGYLENPNLTLENNPEGRTLIEEAIDNIFEMSFSKASMRKIKQTKVIVNWPNHQEPFSPVLHRVEVFRYSETSFIAIVIIGS